jgi:hypothetical protein
VAVIHYPTLTVRFGVWKAVIRSSRLNVASAPLADIMQARPRGLRLPVWVIGSILGLMRCGVPLSGEFLFQWKAIRWRFAFHCYRQPFLFRGRFEMCQSFFSVLCRDIRMALLAVINGRHEVRDAFFGMRLSFAFSAASACWSAAYGRTGQKTSGSNLTLGALV